MAGKFLLFICLLVTSSTSKAQIDLSTGQGKSASVQSYNETRALDLTVLGQSLLISSVRLDSINSAADTLFVLFRVYDSKSAILLYAKDSFLSAGWDQSLALPVSFDLRSGDTYRLGFHCRTNSDTFSCSGTLYQPFVLPYIEDAGLLRIDKLYSSAPGIIFPDRPNLFAPYISMKYEPLLGIAGISKESPVLICPNPFSHSSTLQFYRNVNNASLLLYNMQGQLVKQEHAINGNSVVLSRGSLPVGSYFIQLIEQGCLVAKMMITIQ